MEANENTYILENSQTEGAFTISKNHSQNTGSDDNEQLTEPRRIVVKSNSYQTVFNFVNSIIGSGVIGIPYALRRCGFGLGVILLVAIAIITDYSLIILVKAGNLAGVSTYQDTVQAAFGRTGFYLLSFIQFIYPFIAMISYNVIVGDTATKVFRRVFKVNSSHAFGNRNSVVFFCTLIIMLPLSLKKDIAKLNKISLLSLLFIFIILGFIIFRLFSLHSIIPPSDDAYVFARSGVTEAIGIIAFAYMCHHNSFLLYDSLENPTQKRWNNITHISLGLSCVIVLVVGVAGYLTFTQLSQGDLFENYCFSDDLANIARILFTITIMLTYPIECFVVREVLENVFWSGKPPTTGRHHLLITSVIVSLAFISSTITDCLGIVLELNGIITAVPLAYILPALTFLKLDPNRLWTWTKAPALSLAVFGFVVAICGIFYTFFRVINGVTCSHGDELPYCDFNSTAISIAN